MKLFSSCFTAPQSKHLLVLTGIWTLVMVIATFIAIGASADDASPDGLTIPILTVGMFAVRYMATQQGWKYGRLVSNTAGLPSFPKTFPDGRLCLGLGLRLLAVVQLVQRRLQPGQQCAGVDGPDACGGFLYLVGRAGSRDAWIPPRHPADERVCAHFVISEGLPHHTKHYAKELHP